MGHINYKDLNHLEQHVEGMKISDFKIENCETCELNKAKKKPVPKDFYTRATRTLDFESHRYFRSYRPASRGWT